METKFVTRSTPFSSPSKGQAKGFCEVRPWFGFRSSLASGPPPRELIFSLRGRDGFYWSTDEIIDFVGKI